MLQRCTSMCRRKVMSVLHKHDKHHLAMPHYRAFNSAFTLFDKSEKENYCTLQFRSRIEYSLINELNIFGLLFIRNNHATRRYPDIYIFDT